MLNLLKLKVKDNKLGVISKKGDHIGSTRYYPPASQEWFDSIYAYNKNTTKLLPVADNVVISLIRSYFNMYSRNLEAKIKAKRLRVWMRRISSRKVFVSKPELKHSSDKVIITLYIYNRQYNYYLEKMSKIVTLGFTENIKVNKLARMFKASIKKIHIKTSLIINNIKKETKFLAKTLNWKGNNITNYENNFKISHIKVSFYREIFFMYYNQLLFLNRFKFNDTYITPLKNLISKIYEKKIEFNLITLETYYQNSDIFSQIVTLKASNRKNKVLKVLKNSLRVIKIPKLNKVKLSREPTKLIGVKNLIINDLLLSDINDSNNDSLNLLLNNQFNSFDLQDTVLDAIKYKNVGGVKIQAAGRLTKRITASRSILKFRYVGTLRNIDSSYRGLSSAILRGNQKSNIQFTKLNSKTRIGSFGIKGWVSSH